MIVRPQVNRRNRKTLPPSFYPPGAAVTAVVTLVATKARVTCDMPVMIDKLPVGITRQAAGSGPQLAPIAVTVISPTVFDLTYAASCVATDKITIPANVPQVKGQGGGSLAALVTTF